MPENFAQNPEADTPDADGNDPSVPKKSVNEGSNNNINADNGSNKADVEPYLSAAQRIIKSDRITAADANALIDQLEAEATVPPKSTFSVLMTPKWLAGLLVVLLIVCVFLGLGYWQMSRSFVPGNTSGETEKVVPISNVMQPNGEFPVKALEQRVQVSGEFLPNSATVYSNHTQGDKVGYWIVVGVYSRQEGILPVALGWTDSLDHAKTIAQSVNDSHPGQITLSGRLLPYDSLSQETTPGDKYLPSSINAAELVNLWHDSIKAVPVQKWYEGFMVAWGDQAMQSNSTAGTCDDNIAGAPSGSCYADYASTGQLGKAVNQHLVQIYSPCPDTSAQFNWLNIFYAAEWLIFAIFSVYLWYRLGKDEYQHALEQTASEREELELLRRLASK